MCVWGIQGDGSVGFETSYSQGQVHQVQVDLPDVLRRCRESRSAAVVFVHNHPPGYAEAFSAQDSAATVQQARLLGDHGITLLSSSVVSPPQEAPRVQESHGECLEVQLATMAWRQRQQAYDHEPAYLREARARLEAMRGGR
jgi:hypothetical protein